MESLKSRHPSFALPSSFCSSAPTADVILEYLNFSDPGSSEENEESGENGVVKTAGDFKYLRALAAFYVRLNL